MFEKLIRKYKKGLFIFVTLAVLALSYVQPVFTFPHYSEETAVRVENELYGETKAPPDTERITKQFVSSAVENAKDLYELKEKVVKAGKEFSDTINSSNDISGIIGNHESAPAAADNELVNCPSGFEAAELIRVCDGDTIYVKIISVGPESKFDHLGEEAYIRLIGVNTPESSAAEKAGYHEATEFGELASKFTKELLKDTKYVWLSCDASDKDRYDRLLRYVWIEEPSQSDIDDQAMVSSKTLNAVLLEEGYADVMFLNDRKYEELFKQILKDARSSKKGLWQYSDNIIF